MKREYPFGDEWKRTVDRCGHEWAEYCEAISLVKRYLKTRMMSGKQAAVEEFEETCRLFEKNSVAKEGRVRRLKQVFLLVWENERSTLESQVIKAEEVSMGHAA